MNTHNLRVAKAVDQTYFLSKLTKIPILGSEIESFAETCLQNYGHLMPGTSIDDIVNELNFYIGLCELSKVGNIKDAAIVSADLPIINMLVTLLEILPASNAQGERAFSLLEFIKSKRRATMSQIRTSHLACIKANKDLVPTADKIVEKFRSDSSKRINIYF